MQSDKFMTSIIFYITALPFRFIIFIFYTKKPSLTRFLFCEILILRRQLQAKNRQYNKRILFWSYSPKWRSFLAIIYWKYREWIVVCGFVPSWITIPSNVHCNGSNRYLLKKNNEFLSRKISNNWSSSMPNV